MSTPWGAFSIAGKLKVFFALFFLCCLGFAFRAYKLDSRSIWADETFTLLEGSGQLQDLDLLLNAECNATGLKKTGPKPSGFYLNFIQFNKVKGLKDVAQSVPVVHTPLYFFIMHFWMKCFGSSLFTVRFFSVLCGIIAIIFSYLFTMELFGKWAGIFSAIFVAFSPFSVFYSQEARNYSLIISVALISSYLLVRFIKDGKGVFPVWFALSTAAGLYIHSLYFLVFLSHSVYFIFFSGAPSKMRDKFCLALLASIASLFPWAAVVMRRGYDLKLVDYIFNNIPYSLADIGKSIINGVILFFATPDSNSLLIRAMNYFLIFCLFLLGFRLVKKEKKIALPAIIFFSSILALSCAAFFFNQNLFLNERYYVFAFVGIVPLTGYIFALSWDKLFIKIAVAACLLVLVLNSSLVVSGFAWQGESAPRTKELCSWIDRQARRSDSAVIIYNRRAYILPMAFYLNRDILIAPINESMETKELFKQLAYNTKNVFVVQFIFKYLNCFTMNEKILNENASNEKFVLSEKRDFDNGLVKVYKYVHSNI